MNLELFTVEEENLICIYNVSNRTALTNSIRTAIPDFDEPEMCEIAENVLKKLDAMTDAEFSALTFDPAYSDYNNEVEV